MKPKRLFIVDAMALAFRSYYALGANPLTTSKGQPTSAVYASAMFMNKLITEERPDYLVVACDSRDSTFRHEIYEDYKANRSEMPKDLAAQLPQFFELLEAYGCKILKQPGVEADDLIGALAVRLAAPDLHIYIVSGDKDFMQLINDWVFLYVPKKGTDATIIDREGVFKKFSCKPHQVIDCLALIGDSSDNVPGVPGIGEKGAAKLISNYHDLDGIYEHLDQISNKKQRQALEQYKDQAYLSRQLVTLRTDIDVNLNLESFRCDPERATTNDKLLKLYEELEFRSLHKKLADDLAKPDATKAAKENAVGTTEGLDATNYKLVNTREKLDALMREVTAASEFSFDTETTGLDIIESVPIGFSISVKKGEAYYLPLVDKHLDDISREQMFQHALTILGRKGPLKIGHNLKFDLQMLANVGISVAGPFCDTMIMSHLLDSSRRDHGLDACCLRFLNYKKIPTSKLIGENGQLPMLEVDLEDLYQYACEDADTTFRLFKCLAPLIDQQEQTKVLHEVEMPLVPVLARMEQDGIYVDAGVLDSFSTRLADMILALEKRIYAEAGEEFNINSPKQLQEILFNKLAVHEKLGVKRLKKTKSGYSTDESVLSRLKAHPIAKALLEYRTVHKLKNTYVDTLPQLISPKTGRIHTSFHQTGTATGRLSSSNPNLQNIPIRTELGQEIRKAFRPSEQDWVIVSADYSQIELRLLAHIAGEESLAQAFRDGQDIHRMTASKIFAVAPDDVDAVMRSRAKAINFGIIYGMGSRRLSAETGVSIAEAASFIEKYFTNYPRIKDYIRIAIDSAREKGYSETITGRRRPITGIGDRNGRTAANSENIAVNSPIQGSAADLIKLAMIRINERFAKERIRAKMLLQVHDELVFECPKDELEDAIEVIRDSMEHAMDLDVPLTVEINSGNNWLEAH